MNVTNARSFVIDAISNGTRNTVATRRTYTFGLMRTLSYRTRKKKKPENYLTDKDNNMTLSPKKRKMRN